jgi:hypothetical protein
MAKVLVVANRTAESEELLAALKARNDKGDNPSFTLLVPSTPHGVSWAADMHSGGDEAEAHMRNAVQKLRDQGLDIEGKVGDPDANAAVQDEVNFTQYDEVIVSTLHRTISKWLKVDLPHRVERLTGLPVTHVEGSEVKTEA